MSWESMTSEEIVADLKAHIELIKNHRPDPSEVVVRIEMDQDTYDWWRLRVLDIVDKVGIHQGTLPLVSIPIVVVEDFVGARAVYADGHVEEP